MVSCLRLPAFCATRLSCFELTGVAALAQAIEQPFLKIRPPTALAVLNLGEVWRFRDLLIALANRDVKLRYKQTALGVVWVVLQPLIAAAVFAVVFGRLAKLPSDGIPYFLFAYVGLLAWNLFNNTITRASTCLVSNSALISKIYFPRLVLPLSTVPSALIDFSVALAMLMILMPLYHHAPPPCPAHLSVLAGAGPDAGERDRPVDGGAHRNLPGRAIHLARHAAVSVVRQSDFLFDLHRVTRSKMAL